MRTPVADDADLVGFSDGRMTRYLSPSIVTGVGLSMGKSAQAVRESWACFEATRGRGVRISRLDVHGDRPPAAWAYADNDLGAKVDGGSGARCMMVPMRTTLNVDDDVLLRPSVAPQPSRAMSDHFRNGVPLTPTRGRR